MAQFSLARVPYYMAVAVFMGLVALVSYINNTIATGIESDLYLGVLVISAGLSAISLFYIFISQAGNDDEVGVEVAGLPFGKAYYYLGVLGIAIWRIAAGYQMNHAATGIHSTYGILWVVAGLGIAAFTWANYRSYVGKNPNSSPLSRF